jgi:uncharacterized protein
VLGAVGDYIRAFAAIRGGDVAELERVLDVTPGLAASRLGAIGRTPLHVVCDWPSYFPNGPRIAQLLIAAGAEVDALTDVDHGETPLHWAASNDDADVARVLIEAGADIEMAGGSIGTPLANAVGYGCWNVARLLVERGAKVNALWIAAALGLLERVEELLEQPDQSTAEKVSQAFWHACCGHQRRAAERLLAAGADIGWVPEYAGGTLLDAASGPSTRQANVIEWLTEMGVHASTGSM